MEPFGSEGTLNIIPSLPGGQGHLPPGGRDAKNSSLVKLSAGVSPCPQMTTMGLSSCHPHPEPPSVAGCPRVRIFEYFFGGVLISDCLWHLIFLSRLVQPPHEYSAHMEDFSLSLPINTEDNHSSSYREVREGLSSSPRCGESWETKGG